jgi:hypothetical protein
MHFGSNYTAKIVFANFVKKYTLRNTALQNLERGREGERERGREGERERGREGERERGSIKKGL